MYYCRIVILKIQMHCCKMSQKKDCVNGEKFSANVGIKTST